ncbi:MAG: hypothetical protein C0501_18940 [Isosphaera sp.]|nr:hypothetical protein [Isosphaera sp.]
MRPGSPHSTSSARRAGRLVLAGLLAASALGVICALRAAENPPAVRPAPPSADLSRYKGVVAPFVAKHCVECHGPDEAAGELRLDTLSGDLVGGKGAAEHWQEVLNRLDNGTMPPKKRPRPTAEELTPVTGWVRAELAKAVAARKEAGGRSAVRRLNRQEYANTLRDLLGVAADFSAELPPDGTSADGFTNNGTALGLSPLHLEVYVAAARAAVAKAVVTGPRPPVHTYTILPGGPADQGPAKQGSDAAIRQCAAKVARQGEVRGTGVVIAPRRPAPDQPRPIDLDVKASDRVELGLLDFPNAGELRIRVRVGAVRADRMGPPVLRVLVENRFFGEVEVTAATDAPGVYELRRPLEDLRIPWQVLSDRRDARGQLRVALFNVYTLPPWATSTIKNKVRLDPSLGPKLVVDSIEVDGPYFDQWPPASHSRILFPSKNAGDEGAYAREVLERFMSRAYRRPPRPDEVDRMLALFRKARPGKASFDEAIRVPLTAVLSSPGFLFLTEAADADGPPQRRRLNDFELATRLSYFLWSTMPDDELAALAAAGKLRDPQVLERQVLRMIRDPRSEAFVRAFTAGWLDLAAFERVVPASREFDAHLRESMAREPAALFAEVLRGDEKILRLVDADFAMLNERLARHYGVEGVLGDGFRRVRMPPDLHRGGGLLTQAATLTATGDGRRTLPIKRGAWVLKRLLDDPPPPPPPDVPELKEDGPDAGKLSLKQQLARHRDDAACAGCHAKIDPWGFPLENFDALGLWRTKDHRGRPIDATGELPNGLSLGGPDDLRKALLTDKKPMFLRAVTRKLLAYALGRSLDLADRDVVEQLSAGLGRHEKLSQLIVDIAKSEPFQTK